MEPIFSNFNIDDDYQKSSSFVDQLVDEAKADSSTEKAENSSGAPVKNISSIIKGQQTEIGKLKSIKPKTQLLMKGIDNKLCTAKFKNAKETFLKGKLNKGFASRDIDSSNGIKSNETLAKTDDDKNDIEFMNPEQTLPDPDIQQNQTVSTINLNSSLAQPQMKSKLSLKSRAYVKSKVPNFNNSPDLPQKLMNNRYQPNTFRSNTIDMPNRMSYEMKTPALHRHSLPQKSMGFNQTMVNYTPSTNYSIPSSEGKMSIMNPHMSQTMQMQTYSPVPFDKFHSNSHESFNTVDNSYYAQMPQKPIMAQNQMMNNTVPLPEMSSFRSGGQYYSRPDINMQPYYNLNMGSAGALSNSSDYIPPQMNYYNPNMGSTWPKIPQMAAAELPKYSTLPDQKHFKNARKTLNKDKSKFGLKIDNIINGVDKRTTLMIRNIPNKYNQTMLTTELDMNHQGLYDIIYLPIDPKNQCNCGYAFINVVHPVIILSLLIEFNGKNWRNFNSEKICELTYGRLQGKQQLLSQLEGSGVMQQSDPSKKPLMLDTIEPCQKLLDNIVNEFKSVSGLSSEENKQNNTYQGY